MRSAIVVAAWPGQPSCAELERQAAAGERPRKDYVELARILDADVIDSVFLEQRGSHVARTLAGRGLVEEAQVAEVLARRNDYRHIVAWGDRLGTLIALLFKLSGSRRDLVMVSVWLSTRKKVTLLKRFGLHTHIGTIIGWSSVQMALAAKAGVPREKLAFISQRIDESFWQPDPGRADRAICSVGSEARDYPTLLEALRGSPIEAELVVGSMVFTPAEGQAGRLPATMRPLDEHALPPNVTVHRHLQPVQLRQVYARSRFVVIPLVDVEFDAGATAVLEAMAMGKAVIVSRTRWQVDLVRERETGLYVPCGDRRGLRAAIEYLLAHPEEAERMGRAARARVEREFSLDSYLAAFAATVRGESRPGPL